jgi:hypothetical protein
MIITSQPLTVGSITATETTVNLILNTQLGPNGNKTTASVTGQRFIRDGSATIPVGVVINKGFSDVFAVAESNPDISAEVQIIMESLARLAPLIGL